MPAVFHQLMGLNSSENPQAHGFTDDILVVTERLEIEHILTVKKIMKSLDEKNDT